MFGLTTFEVTQYHPMYTMDAVLDTEWMSIQM